MRRPQLQYSKPYTDAIRALATNVPHTEPPAAWGDRKTWSGIQVIAERDFMRAMAGDQDAITRVIDRLEGRPPSAPEDRATRNAEAEANTVAGFALLARLQSVIQGKAVDVELLPEGEGAPEGM